MFTQKRFRLIHRGDINGMKICIIEDTETGVNYLMLNGISAGGITPLLDSNGNVIINK